MKNESGGHVLYKDVQDDRGPDLSRGSSRFPLIPPSVSLDGGISFRGSGESSLLERDTFGTGRGGAPEVAAMMRHGMKGAALEGNMSIQLALPYPGSSKGGTQHRMEVANSEWLRAPGSSGDHPRGRGGAVSRRPRHPRPSGRTRPGHPRGLLAIDRYSKTGGYFVEYPEDIKLLGRAVSTAGVSISATPCSAAPAGTTR